MPKKSAAHQKKVDEAVRILNTTTGVGVIVPQAMILVGFPKKDIANETVRRMIRRRLEALEAKQRPLMVVVVTNNNADLSTLTGEDTTTTSGSLAAGESIPPHFQFQTSATSAEGEAIRIEMVRFLLPVEGIFGWGTKPEFPISFGLNSKGGMDDDEFFEYIQKTIMKLFPDAAPVRGWWVILKCDSGLRRRRRTRS